MGSQRTSSAPPCLRIGTRGSKLALAQAHQVKGRLLAAHPDLAPDDVEIVVISTTGDRVLDRPLADIGGKGLFVKEVEEALAGGAVDLAVHSMKDVETVLADGFVLAAMLPREDPRDVLVGPGVRALGDLPREAVVGTSSLRRAAQLRHRRPDLRVVPFRGNVETRLAKLARGEADATLLALAGLRRLGLEHHAAGVLDPVVMLPAAGQGAIGIEVRADDSATRARVAPLDDPDTHVCVACERAVLEALDGSCRTPIGAYAVRDGTRVRLDACVLRPDGSVRFDAAREGTIADAVEIGRDAGSELRGRAGPGFF
jgi:hydroxymethylbilane synthase